MYKAIRALPPSPKSQVLGLLGKGPLPVAAAVLFLLDRRIKSLMRVATKKEPRLSSGGAGSAEKCHQAGNT